MLLGTLLSAALLDLFQMIFNVSFDNVVRLSSFDAHTAGKKPPDSSPASADMSQTSSPDIVIGTFTFTNDRGRGLGPTLEAEASECATFAVATVRFVVESLPQTPPSTLSTPPTATILDGLLAGVGAPPTREFRRVGTGAGT